jgi:DNA-binding NarL/FixJ family response regulator
MALINKEKAFEMSPRERADASILVVEPEPDMREQMRSALRTAGYTNLYLVADHLQALNVLMGKHFTHSIFTTIETSMPVPEYVSRIMEASPSLVAIAASFQPNADDVFELLQLGARGFIVKPYTAHAVELGVLMATKGDPLSEAVLHARDRNEAFSALIAANLDKLADAMRQARTFPTAARDVERLQNNFRGIAELARMFADGGDEKLLERLIEFFIELGSGPASRLGRLRHNLRRKRNRDDAPDSGSTRDSSPG